MRWKALLFDLDGTLVDSLGDLSDAVNRSLVHFGRETIPEATVRRFIGDGMPQLLQRALAHGDGPEPQLEEVIAVFRADYAEHYLDRTTWFDGIEALLDRAACPMGIVSNKPLSFCNDIVRGLGPEHRFGIVLGGDGPTRKPSPQPLWDALEVLGAAAEGALMIGDGIQDLRAARAAGVASCAVTWGMSSEEELRAEDPTFLVRSVEELSALVLEELRGSDAH